MVEKTLRTHLERHEEATYSLFSEDTREFFFVNFATFPLHSPIKLKFVKIVTHLFRKLSASNFALRLSAMITLPQYSCYQCVEGPLAL